MLSKEESFSGSLMRAHAFAAEDDAPRVEDERLYLTRRAGCELEATLRATCIESEIAHNSMTRTYLAQCRSCDRQRTAVCVTCIFRHVCEAGGPLHPAQAKSHSLSGRRPLYGDTRL